MYILYNLLYENEKLFKRRFVPIWGLRDFIIKRTSLSLLYINYVKDTVELDRGS